MDVKNSMNIDEENVQTKEPIEGDDRMYLSPYAREFNETCPGWGSNPEENLFYLLAQQHHANEMLKRRRHLFLNEVLDLIGMSHTEAGEVVGYIYDEENPVGDNYVDFDLFSSHNQRYFYGEEDGPILLDFNVDGEIKSRLQSQ